MLKIIGIYAAIVTLAAAGLFWLMIDAREKLASSEVARKADITTLKTEIKGLEQNNQLLEKRIEFSQQQITWYGERTKEVQVALDKRTAEYESYRTTLAKRTLAKPEVTRRASRRAVNDWMRRNCTTSGGSEDDCRTSPSPGTALTGTRDSSPARDRGGDTGAQPSVE